jgi:hypothetical protein
MLLFFFDFANIVNQNLKCKLFKTKIPKEPLGGFRDFAPIKASRSNKNMIEIEVLPPTIQIYAFYF